MRKVIEAVLLAVLAFVGDVAGNVSPLSPEAMAVSNPSQLQEAVRAGTRHVVINQHLDMTATPRFSETTVLDAAMLAIVRNENGEYTQSIVVRRYLQRAACACVPLDSYIRIPFCSTCIVESRSCSHCVPAGAPDLQLRVAHVVLHGESRVSPATPRNQNNNQPSRGQPREAVQISRNQTKLQRDTPSQQTQQSNTCVRVSCLVAAWSGCW